MSAQPEQQSRPKPAPLSAHATLGLFCPGSRPDPAHLQSGLEWLESSGMRHRLGRSVESPAEIDPFPPHRHLLAGPPAARAADLHALWDDPSVDALLAVRGGGGTLGVLPHVDWPRLARRPKLLLGMSDLSALQWALLRHTGLPSISCPTLVQMGHRATAYTSARWLALTRATGRRGPIPMPRGTRLRVARAGVAEGTLMPGNLSLVTRLIGTPHLPDLAGCILVLEDIQETPQSLDRMLTQLSLSGVTQGIRGIVLGQFTACRGRETGVTEDDSRALLLRWAETQSVPAVHGFPYGHDRTCAALPVGTRARLTTDPPALELLESPTSGAVE